VADLRYKDKKNAFVHDKSTYGKGLADEVKANLKAAGVPEKFSTKA
jgi:branched-chain amino acid transport system substrate-binding protein